MHAVSPVVGKLSFKLGTAGLVGKMVTVPMPECKKGSAS